MRPAPHPWIIVLVGFAALALSFSTRMTMGVAMPTWERALGWSRELISGNGAIGLIVMAALFPLVGVIVDRIGTRAVLVLGTVMLAAAGGVMALMSAPWHLTLAYSVLGGIGFTLVGNTAVSVMVARAFEANRGLATGIATSGATGGQLLLVPLLTIGFATIGWRWSLGMVAASALVLALLVFILLRGERAAPGPVASSERATFGRALAAFGRDPGFHALAASFFVCGATTTGIIETHFIPFAIACGFPPLPSALAYSVLAATNFFGMMLFGWMCDRYNRSYLLGAIYAIRGLAFLMLLAVGSDYRLLILFAVIAGMVEYATLPATAGLAAARYGVANLGKAMGLLMTAHSLGAALGAYAGGGVFARFGSYDLAWIGSALAALTAALIVLACSDPRRQPPRPRTAGAAA